MIEQARLIREGSLSSRELVAAHLARIAQVNPTLNAAVEVQAERALLDAGETDRKVAAGDALGPLHGVPFTIKDSIEQAGARCTAGATGLLLPGTGIGSLPLTGTVGGATSGASGTRTVSTTWRADTGAGTQSVSPAAPFSAFAGCGRAKLNQPPITPPVTVASATIRHHCLLPVVIGRPSSLLRMAGSLRGRKLNVVVHEGMRPTPQMVREAFFSILGNAVPDRVFYDVFAGTGVVGLEAVSRGASSARLIEKDPRQVSDIQKHADAFGVGDKVQVLKADAYRWAERWLSPRATASV